LRLLEKVTSVQSAGVYGMREQDQQGIGGGRPAAKEQYCTT
jgi:hypothetical protein